MALISRSLGFVFLLAPRTGCTAIGQAMRETLDVEWLPQKSVLAPDGRIVVDRKHCTARQLVSHGLLTPGELDELLVVCGVRNPFDSLVSLYAKQSASYTPLLEREKSWVKRIPGYTDGLAAAATGNFDEWLRVRLRPRSTRGRAWRALRLPVRATHLYGRYLRDTDVVLRFERLQEDVDALMDRVGGPRIEVPRVNVTDERIGDYRLYYSPASRRMVERHFRPDLERFDYRF